MEEAEIKIRRREGVFPKMQMLCKPQTLGVNRLMVGERWESMGGTGTRAMS